MNKNLNKIKQLNRKPIAALASQTKQTNSILQNIKCAFLGFLTLALLMVGFGNIEAKAVPFNDFTISQIQWQCEKVGFINSSITCLGFSNIDQIPVGFQLGINGSFGGLLIINQQNFTISGIPTPSLAGNFQISYQGPGVDGGTINQTVSVADTYLTPAQDSLIPKFCGNSYANVSYGEPDGNFPTYCFFGVPTNTTIPIGYQLGVFGSALGGSCKKINSNEVYCNGFNTGNNTGIQSIISTLNPLGANGNINIYPFITATDESSIQFYCSIVLIGTPSNCSALISGQLSIPQNYRLGVGIAPGGDICRFNGFTVILCNNVPTSMIVGQNNINSTLNPNGIGLTSRLIGYMTSSDEPNLQFQCDTANTNSTTNCHANFLDSNYVFNPNYQVGVGTLPGGNCVRGISFPIQCTDVPTGLQAGSNVRINSILSPQGINFTGVISDMACYYPTPFNLDQPNSFLNLYNIFQPITASASAPIPVPDCCPIHPQVVGCTAVAQGGGVVTINQASTNSAVSSSITQSTTTTQVQSGLPKPNLTLNSLTSKTQASTSSPTETASTKIYDPFKLNNGKKRPASGVLSSVDDKASIDDPYICGGDIHGYVDYSGDYNNVEVIVEIKDSVSGLVQSIPVVLDPIDHLYVAKIDYRIIKESNYDIKYSVYSKFNKKLLDQGNYSAFITKNCGTKKVENITLARTGGKSNLTNISFVLAFILGIAGISSFGKDNNKIIKN